MLDILKEGETLKNREDREEHEMNQTKEIVKIEEISENYENEMSFSFKSISQNITAARAVVVAFLSPLDPLIADLNDIKTSVSEAITNSIIHGYNSDPNREVNLLCRYENNTIYIEIRDSGVGIKNLEQAMEPMYTSKPDEERSGLGFTFMENMMDTLRVSSDESFGTTVYMTKTLSGI